MPRSSEVPNASIKKPSAAALLLGMIPFVGMCLSVSLWDRVNPMIFGLPFNLAWLIAWIVLSASCMAIAYRIESKPKDARRNAP